MKILVFLVLLTGCASVQHSIQLLQDPSSRVVTHQTPKLYAQATSDFEAGKYEDAKTGYEAFLTDQPTTAYTQVANFNLARSFLALKMYPEAIEKFRYVARETTGHAPELQAQSFYQLSFCYEAQGDKVNALASLLDSYKRKKYFSNEIASAEIPARIAGAYASLGNFEQAKVYYSQAEDGVRQLKREIRTKQIPDWLPRTLFYMGEVSLRKISLEDVESMLKPLEKAQVYLLESSELGQSTWSQKAATELIHTYESACEVISKAVDGKSEVASARAAQVKQWELAQDFLKVLEEMKIYERPDQQNQNALTQSIFKSVSESKEKLLSILDQPKIGQDITEDSKARKRRRVVAPNSVLEKDYMKNREKKAPETPPHQDPNL